MYELILEWTEENRVKTHKISDQKPSRIGRDPTQCEVVLTLTDQAISRQHAEIFFNHQQNCFYIKNLKTDNNPALINGQILTKGEVPLKQGSTIKLGHTEIKVAAISSQVPPTVLVSPQPPVIKQPNPPQPNKLNLASLQSAPTLGLKCPKCSAILDYKLRVSFCSNCGQMLADAESVLYNPHNS